MSYKNIGIYHIRYITMKNIGDKENINSVNSLYLIIGKADGHTKESIANKYFTFAPTGKKNFYSNKNESLLV